MLTRLKTILGLIKSAIEAEKRRQFNRGLYVNNYLPKTYGSKITKYK